MANAEKLSKIEVDINIDEAQKELAGLRQQFQKLKKETKEVSLRRNGLVQQSEELAANLKDAQYTLQYMEGMPEGTFRKEDIVEQKGLISGLQNSFAAIENEIKACDDKIQEGNSALDDTKQKYSDVLLEAQSLAEEEARRTQKETGDQENTGGVVAEARDAVGEMERLEVLAEKIAQAIKGSLKDPAPKPKPKDGWLQKIKEMFAKGIDSANKFKEKMANLTKDNIFSKIGAKIKDTLITNVVKNGLSYLGSAISQYLNENEAFTSALERLKSGLRTAFQPIFDAVIPALTALLNIVTRAVAVVGQFLAALFGKTAGQAADNTKALNEEADALKSTGGAAEEAAGSLAGFDEINTIQTENKGGEGGGGGAGTDTADEGLLDEAFDGAEMLSWGEAFSDFLDTILNQGLPMLREGFAKFGEWMNGFSGKLYEMFKFEGIKEKVKQVGEDLAGAFNELVAGINWELLGQAIGAGLGLALTGAVSFLYTFDWKALAGSFADLINGIVSEIDWVAVGGLLWSKFKIAIDLFVGFILGLDMAEILKGASQIVIGFFDGITETVEGIDWTGLAKQVVSLVTAFFVDADWDGMATSVFTALGTAFGAAAAFLWELIGEAWQSVIDWWHDAAYEDGKFTWEGLKEGIVNAISNIGTWIKEHIFGPFMEGFQNVFGIHSPSTVMAEMGGYLMEGLLGGLLENAEPVLEAVKTILNGILDFVTGVFTGDWESAWEGVKNIFRGLWNGIVSILEGAVNLIIDGINWMIGQLNRLQIAMPDWLGGGTIGFNIQPLGRVAIPRLATGAVIPPNREFLAVLGDQTSGMNIEAPEALIRQIVREESGGNTEVVALLQQLLTATKAGRVMYVDKKVLARSAAEGINDMTRMSGKPVLVI